MEHEIETNVKIKNNAMSAYLMFFICWLFLTNGANPLLANNFVRSHAKTALSIHFGFLLVVLVFLWFWLGESISILNVPLSNILASTLLTWLFWVMLFGFYKAHKGEYFTIGEVVHLAKTEKLIDINNDHTLDEKDKLSLILSYVPLWGFTVYGMHSHNLTLKNISKLNLLCSSVITGIYIAWHTNLALLLGLLYIIFIVFTSIILVWKNEIFSFNLESIPTLVEAQVYVQTFLLYLKWYFSKNFIPLSECLKKVEEEITQKLSQNKSLIANFEEFPYKKILIYIPLVNFFTLTKLSTKMHFHIINGVSLSLLFIGSWLLLGIDNTFQSFFVFVIFYWIGFLSSEPLYTLPFIYPIGNHIISWGQTIISHLHFARKMSAHKEEVSLKPNGESNNSTQNNNIESH